MKGRRALVGGEYAASHCAPSAALRVPAGRRQRGGTRLELAVAILVLCLAAGILLSHFIAYQRWAERTAVQLTVQNLRTALRWQMVDRLLHGASARLDQLEGANPVPWLAQAPDGYAGEIAPGASAPDASGVWYFDRAQRQLVYVPRWREIAHGATTNTLRWQVRGLKSTAASADRTPVAGLVLAEVVPPR